MPGEGLAVPRSHAEDPPDNRCWWTIPVLYSAGFREHCLLPSWCREIGFGYLSERPGPCLHPAHAVKANANTPLFLSLTLIRPFFTLNNAPDKL
jgi:hypothetical protein